MRQVAAEQGRIVEPDPEPEKGFYYRTDALSFAQAGVPTLEWRGGIDFIDGPEGYRKQAFERFVERDYHRPSDEVKPDWDLSGAVEDLQLWFKVGYRLCQIQTDKPSEWSPGAEFRRFSRFCVSGDNHLFHLERRFDYATDPTRTAR